MPLFYHWWRQISNWSHISCVLCVTINGDESQIIVTSARCPLFYHWDESQIIVTSARCPLFYHWDESQIILTSARCPLFYHWIRWIAEWSHMSCVLFSFTTEMNLISFSHLLGVLCFTTDWDRPQIDLTSTECHIFYHWLRRISNWSHISWVSYILPLSFVLPLNEMDPRLYTFFFFVLLQR